MTEADREVIEIVKELFRSKKGELIDPDALLQEQIVKWSIYMAVFCVVALVPAKIFGSSSSEQINGVLSGVIGVAFTLFFIHLNIKSKNPSFILYGLTWLSLMVSLWLAS
ncbi:hypothetical protein [Neptuniibacter pectenicola]|jgi:uncharacterized membrane protein|uniref:hypothetical protein n=1 Tax=Neptuniibacter pectenicola TaxID=1806669 RepID=UPI00082D47DE|nr:hypothetical protein [Neptuniibacter pectenicola]